MFTQARFKLTAWYLLIIMAVSISFSVIIYTMLISEVERFDRIQRFRIERHLFEDGTIRRIPVEVPPPNPELIQETKEWKYIYCISSTKTKPTLKNPRFFSQ